MSKLFSPLTIRAIELKNRIVVSPMCQYSSSDGFANDWHLVHLGSRAAGGAGLVFTEAAAIVPEGRISPHDLGIWKDEHIPLLQRITQFIVSQNCVPGIQLAHAGRKSSQHRPWDGGKPLTPEEGAWQTIAPSAIPFKPTDPVPDEMTLEAIEQLKNDFKAAVNRALSAGFKVIELHAAHGYLLNAFLSPLSNHRTDDYGGTPGKRNRLLLEITRSTREQIGEDLPLFVRISATDWVPGGFTENDAVLLATALKGAGADLVDCSSGGNSPDQKIPVAPLYQVPFAAAVKKETGLLTAAVGLITTAEEAEKVLEQEQADLVFLARQFLRDPYFPLHAAAELNDTIKWPVQYERAAKKRQG